MVAVPIYIYEAQAQNILTLPVHQALAQEELDYVVEHIRRFYKDS